MPQLSAVLSPADLPWPELQAARLDGELFALAGGFCPVDEIEGPAHRAHAAVATRSRRLICELGTAAWIWGAVPRPPAVLEFCAELTARARLPPNPLAVVRELVLDDGDVARFGAVRVTTPLRTAVDLARFRDVLHPADADAIHALATGRFGLTECDELLERRRNLPGKHRARKRLRQLLGS